MAMKSAMKNFGNGNEIGKEEFNSLPFHASNIQSRLPIE